MPSALTKWLTSIAFGLLVAWASGGVVNPVMQHAFGLADLTGLATWQRWTKC